MSPTTTRRILLACLVLAVVVVAFVLSSCASFDYTEAPRAGHVLVNVVWDEQVARDCHGEYGGCAYAMNGVCTILAPRPRSFDDHDAVETVGHELLHCIGGDHAWR